jgi:hypothetical protein
MGRMTRRLPGAGWAGALCALVLASWLGAATANAGITVALNPPTQSVAPGAEFDLELRVTQAGSQFNGFDAMVTYDPSALTLMTLSPVSLQQGTLVTDACGSTFHRFRAGAGVDTVTDILLCNGISMTGPGQIYRLHFKASNTAQLTAVRLVPGKLKFYDSGLFVNPVTSTDAQVGIGMTPTGVGDMPVAAGLGFAAAPNPSPGRIAFTMDQAPTGAETLSVRDVQGRLIRKIAVTGRQFTWDGRGEHGELVPNGAYFATLEAGGRFTTLRLSLIR